MSSPRPGRPAPVGRDGEALGCAVAERFDEVASSPKFEWVGPAGLMGRHQRGSVGATRF